MVRISLMGYGVTALSPGAREKGDTVRTKN